MTNVVTTLTIMLIVIAITLIIVVLMQDDRAAGLGTVTAEDTSGYWSQNKSRSKEGQLELITKISGGLFMIVSLAISLLLAI